MYIIWNVHAFVAHVVCWNSMFLLGSFPFLRFSHYVVINETWLPNEYWVVDMYCQFLQFSQSKIAFNIIFKVVIIKVNKFIILDNVWLDDTVETL